MENKNASVLSWKWRKWCWIAWSNDWNLWKTQSFMIPVGSIWEDRLRADVIVTCGQKGNWKDPYGIGSLSTAYQKNLLALGNGCFWLSSFLKIPKAFAKCEWPHFWSLWAQSVCLLLLFPQSQQAVPPHCFRLCFCILRAFLQTAVLVATVGHSRSKALSRSYKI